MSNSGIIPKLFLGGGAVGFGYYLYMRQYWFPNPYKTQGVQNIEDRFTAQGGTPTHAPGVATKQGDPNNVQPRQDNPKGVDSQEYKDNVTDQRTSAPLYPKKFYEAQYGNQQGK